MIALFAVTAAGRRAAEELASALGAGAEVVDEPVAQALPRRWADLDAAVLFLATGAAVRLIAPLLADKRTDPGIVCVDEARRFAVALCGGHAGGANALARRVADALGATPVVTTASDATGTTSLDEVVELLGARVDGDLAAAGTALLDGAARVENPLRCPLPSLPPPTGPVRVTIEITDRAPGPGPGGRAPAETRESDVGLRESDVGLRESDVGLRESDIRLRESGNEVPNSRYQVSDSCYQVSDSCYQVSDSRYQVSDSCYQVSDSRGGSARRLRLVPPTLVVGIGSARGVPEAAVRETVAALLADHGLDPAAVRAYASVDLKADEAGILAAIAPAPLRTYPADVLAAVDVPNPSEVVRAEVGTPSVAEAAALHAAAELAGGGPVELVGPKRKGATVTAAVARIRPRGRLAVVGLGPGAADLRVPRADAELRRASIVVGLDQYVDQVAHLLRPGTQVRASGLGAEEQRAAEAVALAAAGHAVALIGSGDAGVYAMGSPALQQAGPDVEVVGVPGVTAALATAALLGAPLGHDHVLISLSDLHTPYEVIERRVRAAAEADLVACFYNPRSRDRDWQLGAALEVLRAHRPPQTPVGAVRQAGRPGQRVWTAPIAAFDPTEVDMLTTVVVGSSATRIVAGRMVTPRGYRWQ